MKQIVKKNILGIGVSDTTTKETLEFIFTGLSDERSPYFVVTPNPEMIMRARKDAQFREILNNAEVSLCDGVGLYLAARILQKPLKERITGVDILEKICKESVRKPVSIGFLGGRRRVAERTAECLLKKYPELQIGFVGEEWGDNGYELATKIQDSGLRIQESKPIDILFVAFGFPKQEKWMAEHMDKGVYRVAIGVGGAFDYLSGNVQRAPYIIRAIGLEWLYRLIRQPWRFKRQLSLITFIRLVLTERLMLHDS